VGPPPSNGLVAANRAALWKDGRQCQSNTGDHLPPFGLGIIGQGLCQNFLGRALREALDPEVGRALQTTGNGMARQAIPASSKDRGRAALSFELAPTPPLSLVQTSRMGHPGRLLFKIRGVRPGPTSEGSGYPPPGGGSRGSQRNRGQKIDPEKGPGTNFFTGPRPDSKRPGGTPPRGHRP